MHGTGPLLVLAGAGSGKTSTMTYRIAHLIAERGVPGNTILGLSFTNKAARELKERVSKLTGKSNVLISTFHSLCVRMLRVHAARLGFRPDFTIVDANDQRDLLKQVFKNVKIDDRKFDLGLILFHIGQAKSRTSDISAIQNQLLDASGLRGDYAVAAATAFEHYQAQLKALNSMDFDDLLIHATRLLDDCKDVRDQYNEKFKYILVDEYQDTNPSQFRILRLLTEKQQNLCVVGDDDQSIYAWRGADPSHILEFARHYPGARTITLDQNYRSTKTILDAANHVISKNIKRHPKRLWSDRDQGEPITEVVLQQDRDEAEFVAEDLVARAKTRSAQASAEVVAGFQRWDDFAILYRSNAQSRVFEEALRRHRVPYKIVGTLSFLERKEVKDVLSLWRVISNPSDDASLRRIISQFSKTVSKGVGRTSLEALNDHAFATSRPLYEALADAATVAPRAAAGATLLRATIEKLRADLAARPSSPIELAAWARSTLQAIDLPTLLADETDDPIQIERKRENVEELVHAAGQLAPDEPEEGEARTAPDLLRDFLTRMTLDAKDDDDDSEESKNQVTLLTLHGSKGLEFSVVYLVGCEDGFLPHKRTIEEAADFSEERRLAYVGITRAKDQLVLTRAKTRIRYGKPVPRVRSRFLDEIPKGLLLIRDESHPDPKTVEDKEIHETKVKNFLADIRAKIAPAANAKPR